MKPKMIAKVTSPEKSFAKQLLNDNENDLKKPDSIGQSPNKLNTPPKNNCVSSIEKRS